jgi:hypothetical protein
MDIDTETLIRDVWADLKLALQGSEGRMKVELDASEARTGARIDTMNVGLIRSITILDARLTAVEVHVAKLEADLAASRKLAAESFARIQRNFDVVQRNFERVFAELADPDKQARLDRIEERLARLEQYVGLPDE